MVINILCRYFNFHLLLLANDLGVVSLTSSRLRQADPPLFMLFSFRVTRQSFLIFDDLIWK